MKDYYQIYSIRKDVYRITSTEHVFMDLLVGNDCAVLIDTGYGFGDLKGTVRKLTDKPLYIVNTHGHVDHTCGDCQFAEDIYIADADLDLLHRHNTESSRADWILLAEHTRNWETGEVFNGLPEEFDREAYIAGGINRFRSLYEGMVFDLGGKTIRVLATPGHTRGSVSFYYEEENWLYMGDAANNFFWLFDSDATDKATYLNTLEKIQTVSPDRLYGSHGLQPFNLENVKSFKRAALEADYDHGVPFYTPIMPDCKDIRVCILDGKTMDDIGDPDFCAILLDESRK